MKWYDRVKEVAKSKQIKQKDIAEMVGISSKVLSHYLVGRSKPGLDVLVKISECVGVSLDWMIKGVEDRYMVYRGESADSHAIPLLDPGNVKRWIEDGVAETASMLPEKLVANKSDKAFFYKVSDMSMGDKLVYGALACVDPNEPVKANDTVLVVKEKGAFPIFRTVIENGNETYLVAEDHRLPTIRWHEGIVVCGVTLYAVTPYRELGCA